MLYIEDFRFIIITCCPYSMIYFPMKNFLFSFVLASLIYSPQVNRLSVILKWKHSSVLKPLFSTKRKSQILLTFPAVFEKAEFFNSHEKL